MIAVLVILDPPFGSSPLHGASELHRASEVSLLEKLDKSLCGSGQIRRFRTFLLLARCEGEGREDQAKPDGPHKTASSLAKAGGRCKPMSRKLRVNGKRT